MFRRTIATAFKWSAKWYFGSITTAAGTFFLMENYFEFERFRSIKYGVAAFILTFLIKVIVQYIKEIDQLEEKIHEKQSEIDNLDTKQTKQKLISGHNFYGEVMLKLKDSFARINETKRTETFDHREFITLLTLMCNKLKHIFENRFKHNYSVCIKVFVIDENNSNIHDKIEVNTLVRDEDSDSARSNGSTIKHQLHNNTCFKEILESINYPSKSYYLNNDLPADLSYKSTSFLNYGSVPNTLKIEERRAHWTLPYKSECVVPLAPYRASESDRRLDFYGYLCVDCDSENGFHKKYDPGMLQGIADGLFDLIKQYHNQKYNV